MKEMTKKMWQKNCKANENFKVAKKVRELHLSNCFPKWTKKYNHQNYFKYNKKSSLDISHHHAHLKT
jgi:hypothetical protein